MNIKDKQTLLKAQNVLRRIENKDRFFFNVAQLEGLELIYSRPVKKPDACGNKITVSWHYYLTEKGRRVMDAEI